MASFRYIMLTLAFLLLATAVSSSGKVLESDPVSIEEDSDLFTSGKSEIRLIQIVICIRKYFRAAPRAARGEDDTAKTICEILRECIKKLLGLTPRTRRMAALLRILIKIIIWLDCRVGGEPFIIDA